MDIAAFIRNHLPENKDNDFILPFDVEQKWLDKDFIVTPYDQVENKILLLNEGIVQISTLKAEEEKILEFVFPGEFFCAYTSFLLQQPSDVQVITLTKCNVAIIKREDLYRANQVSLISSNLSLHIAQQLFLSRARREKDFLTRSAEDRYKKLLEKDPEVIKLIPGNKIAKYLGVQPESLSRIRKSIIT
jgi:CRP-like cAMP-binding protein